MHGGILDSRRYDAELAAVRVLARARSLREAAPQILEGMCRALETDLAALWALDESDQSLHCIEVWRRDESRLDAFELASRQRTYTIGIGLPGRVWQEGQPQWIPDVVTDENFPRAPIALKSGLHASFGFPILAGDTFLGVIEFYSAEIHEPDDDLLEMLATIGTQIGQFISRERLEQRLRDSERWLSFLAEATSLLSASLDHKTSLEGLARLVVPTLADWCVIHIVDEGGEIQPLTMAHSDPDREALAMRLQARYATSEAQAGIANVVRTGESSFVADIDDDVLGRATGDPEELKELHRLGLRSAMIVPLIARKRVLGTITFVTAESGRRYTELDLQRAEDLATRAAMPVDNARLYEERSRIAQTLQRTLLPPDLPEIPGAEVAARYYPAVASAEVGGDFYDLFPMGPTRWGLVLGDVSGKGIEAAAVTALARHTLRTAAKTTNRPSEILSLLNSALLEQVSGDKFCTAAFVIIEPRFGRVQLTASSGGHPLPYVVRSGGAVEPVNCEGTLLGVVRNPVLQDVSLELDFGDKLFLYTDGIFEVRKNGWRINIPDLEKLLSTCSKRGATASAESLARTVLDGQAGHAQDDFALIVLGVKASVFRKRRLRRSSEQTS